MKEGIATNKWTCGLVPQGHAGPVVPRRPVWTQDVHLCSWYLVGLLPLCSSLAFLNVVPIQQQFSHFLNMICFVSRRCDCFVVPRYCSYVRDLCARCASAKPARPPACGEKVLNGNRKNFWHRTDWRHTELTPRPLRWICVLVQSFLNYKMGQSIMAGDY